MAITTSKQFRTSNLSFFVSKRAAALPALALLTAIGLSGCQTASTDTVIRIDKAQGSSENIASLTSVINANPQDPEGYNVRGTAYGRGGEFSRALADFNQAIQLNPKFYQAYANRALIYRNMGKLPEAIADYNAALQINPNYDVAYIGRGNLYRQAGRDDDAFNDYSKAISLGTTDGRAYQRPRRDLSEAQSAGQGDRRLLQGDLAVAELARALQ